MGRINLKNIIVHSLDNKKPNGLKLSDFELDNYSEIELQLVKHIQRSQNHDNRKIAKFIGTRNIVRDSCESIFNNEEDFIEKSKIIAEHLYRSMIKTASPANLIICRYLDNGNENLALLKMDFNEIFVPVEEIIEGKLKIRLELINKSLPSKNEKLQKCVFISKYIFDSDCKEPNILILDKQRGKEVSDFFSKSFLNCELINTDNENTGNFIHEFTDFLNTSYLGNPKAKTILLHQLENELENSIGEVVSVPEIIGRLYHDEEEKEKVLESIGIKQNFDFEFWIDEEYIKRRFKKKKYITSNGLSISGEVDVFESESFEITNPDSNGNVDIIIKNITYNIVDNNI